MSFAHEMGGHAKRGFIGARNKLIMGIGATGLLVASAVGIEKISEAQIGAGPADAGQAVTEFAASAMRWVNNGIDTLAGDTTPQAQNTTPHTRTTRQDTIGDLLGSMGYGDPNIRVSTSSSFANASEYANRFEEQTGWAFDVNTLADGRYTITSSSPGASCPEFARMTGQTGPENCSTLG